MTVKNAGGSTQTKTSVMSSMTDVTPTINKVFRYDGTVQLFDAFTPDGALGVELARKLAFVPGRLYTQAEIDYHYPAAVVNTASPTTVLAAGGTTVTFKGQYLTGVTAITLGGTAFTSVTVVDEKTVTAVSPAKTAGTYDVVFTDDSGTLTKTAFLVSA